MTRSWLEAQRLKKRGRIWVRLEESGHRAAAVQTKVKRVARRGGSCLGAGGSRGTKILFGPPDEFAPNATTAIIGVDHNHTNHTTFAVDSRFIGSDAKTGVDESDDARLVTGDDQSIAIKVRLRENHRLQRVR